LIKQLVSWKQTTTLCWNTGGYKTSPHHHHFIWHSFKKNK